MKIHSVNIILFILSAICFAYVVCDNVLSSEKSNHYDGEKEMEWLEKYENQPEPNYCIQDDLAREEQLNLELSIKYESLKAECEYKFSNLSIKHYFECKE